MNADRTLVASYSQALFEAAKKAGVQQAIFDQAVALENAVQANVKMRAFMEAPNIPRESKDELFTKVFGGRVDGLLLNFVRLLIKRGRLDILWASLIAFRDRHRADMGIAAGSVHSAVPLDKGQQDQLKSALERRTGKKLDLDFKVDPALIGGVSFQSGDYLIDFTIAHRLDRLRQELQNTRVA
ncbi:F0F1 ATP synthase subunit delta [soil metagenome]